MTSIRPDPGGERLGRPGLGLAEWSERGTGECVARHPDPLPSARTVSPVADARAADHAAAADVAAIRTCGRAEVHVEQATCRAGVRGTRAAGQICPAPTPVDRVFMDASNVIRRLVEAAAQR